MSAPAFMPVTCHSKKPDKVQDLDKKQTVCHLIPNRIIGYSSATKSRNANTSAVMCESSPAFILFKISFSNSSVLFD